MTIRIGSLFSGYGGLDLGVQAVLGDSRIVWHSEIEPAAVKLLDHHWPGIPNIGDVSVVDWDAVEPVDVITGGFPCQDVSAAGRRIGIHPGSRSGLWSHMCYATARLRPSLVVIENVRGLLNANAHCDVEPCPWCMGEDRSGVLRALGAVLGDLARIGYDARWVSVRASDVGAPHPRFRVFVVAWPAAEPEPTGDDAASDASSQRHGRGEDARPLGRLAGEEQPAARGFAGDRGGADGATADPASHGRHEGRTESTGLVGRPDAPGGGADTSSDTGRERLGREQDTNRVGGVDREAQADPRQQRARQVARDGSAEDQRGTALADPGNGDERPDTGGDRAAPGGEQTDEPGGRGGAAPDPGRVRVDPRRSGTTGETPGGRPLGDAQRRRLDGDGAEPDANRDASDAESDRRAPQRIAGGREPERSEPVVAAEPAPDTDAHGRGGRAERDSGPDESEQQTSQWVDFVRRSVLRGTAPHAPQRREPDQPPRGDQPDEPVGAEPGTSHGDRGGDPAARVRDVGRTADVVVEWGKYGPAIRRWERVLERPAPTPTINGKKGNPQLASPFVEWVMGLPPGHICDVPGLSRAQQLKLLGNGVVPQQAALAVAHMLGVELGGPS